MTLKVILNKSFERKEYEKVERIFLPSLLGDMTLLDNHIPIVTQVNGEMQIFLSNGETESITVKNAIVSVDKENVDIFF